MASTQPPYHTSTFGAPDQQENNTVTPTGTAVGSSSVNAPEMSGAKVADPSSTGAPGAAGVGDTRSHYDPSMTGYNPSTGSGHASNSYSKQDSRAAHAPSTANKEYAADENPTEAKSVRKGDDIGRGIKSTVAGIHGAGESLRGALTSAVDKAFGFDESAAKNDAIARRGEEQIQSGNYQRGSR